MSEDTTAHGAPSRPTAQPVVSVPNPGVRVPAPIIHFCLLGLGRALDFVDPWPLMEPRVGMWIGFVLVSSVTVFSFLGAYQFSRAGTSMLPNRPASHLITVGCYRFSRNPIYLSLVLIHVGIGIWVNSGWMVASAVPAILILDRWLIEREERYLRQRFGADYRRYAARVRRWI